MAISLHSDARGRSLREWALTVGLATLVFTALALLAFDDITTDNASTFPVEYALLLLAGAWALFAGGWLVWARRRVLGITSLMAVLGAAWGQQSIGPGLVPGLRPDYLATAGGVAWFLVLAGILIVLGLRRGGRHDERGA